MGLPDASQARLAALSWRGRVVGAAPGVVVDRRPLRDRRHLLPRRAVPGFVELVGSAADGMVFFVGSIFFTSARRSSASRRSTPTASRAAAAGARCGSSRSSRRIDWWSSVVQFAGTLLFNVNTFHALQTGLDDVSYDRLVWTPDVIGSALLPRLRLPRLRRGLRRARLCWRGRSLEWRIAAVNLARLHRLRHLRDRGVRRAVDRERPRSRSRELRSPPSAASAS